jgi:hypothetical protein
LRRNSWLATVALLATAAVAAWFAIGLIRSAGCAGEESEVAKKEKEKQEEDKKKKKKEEEKKKQRIEPYDFVSRPSTGVIKQVAVKPGHWTSVTLEAQANFEDTRGELVTDLLAAGGQPASLDGNLFRLQMSRPVILPKGQKRSLEFPLFTPTLSPVQSMETQFNLGNGGRVERQSIERLSFLPQHQYYFVVLAKNPDLYQYVTSLDSVKFPGPQLINASNMAHYRVILPNTLGKTPIQWPMLPSNALKWTTTAYLLWDEMPPETLTADQQQALIDWLHWGGQLIVSGPGTLDTLKGSFLEPYLPATGGEAWTLDQQALAPMNGWKVLNKVAKEDRDLKAVQPWTGVKLKLHPEAEPTDRFNLGDEPLVADRRIGRGRVVVTAFRLSQRELRDWPSFDGFFNACLLLRPPRRFADDEVALHVKWTNDRSPYDPQLVSNLRYFTRDASSEEESSAKFRINRQPMPNAPYGRPQNFPNSPDDFPDGFPEEESEMRGPGVGAWDDASAVSEIARETLRDAAGITVPKASFVVWVLAIYSLVLVPLNWAFFRLLGRVEWAWVAAPFISIAAAVSVVYLAQLDIGFARSRTELAIIEVQGNYERAHLTRYTALYTSLGTSYDFKFDDPTALALPFSPGQDALKGQRRVTVRFHDQRGVGGDEEGSPIRLDGFDVSSNTTAMIHAEQMFDLRGGIELTPIAGNQYKITNNTRYTWRGAGALKLDRRSDRKVHQQSWIGDLAPGQTVTVKLLDGNAAKEWSEQLDELSKRPVLAGLDLAPLVNLAQEQTPVSGVSLVGWLEEELPGLTIEPAASQSRHVGFVIAKLSYGPGAMLEKDANTRAEIDAAIKGRLPRKEE